MEFFKCRWVLRFKECSVKESVAVGFPFNGSDIISRFQTFSVDAASFCCSATTSATHRKSVFSWFNTGPRVKRVHSKGGRCELGPTLNEALQLKRFLCDAIGCIGVCLWPTSDRKRWSGFTLPCTVSCSAHLFTAALVTKLWCCRSPCTFSSFHIWNKLTSSSNKQLLIKSFKTPQQMKRPL